jgi:putative nucleotidyltransferase with HDIG domain
MPSIRELIKKIDSLPSMPSVITELIELTSNPDSDMDEILSLIEKDQSLTAKLLRLCNSSYYGLSQEVSTLRNAVVLLGFKAVYKMVIALGTSVFFKKDTEGYGLSGLDMFRHSVSSAIAAETIANRFDRDKAQSAYTAGLLHDIGKLVLAEYVQNDLERILELVEQGRSFVEAEQETIGMDHGLVGGKLARLWRFPDCLVEAIKYHHDPHLASTHKELVAFAHIGNVISNSIFSGNGVDSFANAIDPKVFRTYHLDNGALESVMESTLQQAQDAESLIVDLVKETATA